GTVSRLDLTTVIQTHLRLPLDLLPLTMTPKNDNMGNGNEDGEAVAEKDGEKQVEEEAEKNGTKEAEKDGAKEAETTPEDAEGEEEAAKEAYEVAGNEDE
ncbi:unnamed protein product, partial [Brassica napus]